MVVSPYQRNILERDVKNIIIPYHIILYIVFYQLLRFVTDEKNVYIHSIKCHTFPKKVTGKHFPKNYYNSYYSAILILLTQARFTLVSNSTVDIKLQMPDVIWGIIDFHIII